MISVRTRACDLDGGGHCAQLWLCQDCGASASQEQHLEGISNLCAIGLMRFHQDHLQILLVFTKEDNQCNRFYRTCEKAAFRHTVTEEVQAILTYFLDKLHDIIRDHRNP